jgi:virulence factor Mce-like protein
MQRLAASPTMVGALTVLIVIVAVFLAYNANNGLPFVPTYRISAEVPDAQALVRGNEVRIGGIRVGLVEEIQPLSHDDGSVSAKLDLKLDRTVKPLPADSTVAVRARSALGLKYLQITKGHSRNGLPEGSALPLSSARPETVDIDQLLNTFDEPTRDAIQRNLVEFGTAVAGRGPELNAGLAELAKTLRLLQPVARNLSSTSTGLDRFFRALEATAAEVAPVAETQAQLFVSLDTTFGALARVARPFIQETISRSPPTLDTANAVLPRLRPFLRHSRALFADLRPSARLLAESAPDLAAALRVGTPVLRATPVLNAELPPTAQALVDFGEAPGVITGINLLTRTNRLLDVLLHFVTPAQTVCNYATLLFRNVSNHLSLGDGTGTYQRFLVLNPAAGANNEGSPASAPANGPDFANHLHYNPYPNTAAPGQPKECEAGNEPYRAGQTLIGNVPGNQGTEPEGQKPKKKKGKS